MKRLFLAVDIDEATRAQVGRISARLRDAIETKTSWVRPDRMHLTLHFLGDADDACEQRVRRALADPVCIAPFDVSFEGLGLFPDRGSPRVLWLGIRDGLDSLRRIEKGLIDRLGVERDHQGAFTPHLTLARFRDRVTRAALVGISQIPASAGPSRIDRVTLYESRLSPKGSTYIPVAEAPLQP